MVTTGNNGSNSSQYRQRQGMNLGYRKGNIPFCTHCNLPGHTKEICYKLHRFPPGYKSRTQAGTTTKSSNHTANQTSTETTSTVQNSGFFQSLDKNQYEQLMNMFNQHLHNPQSRPTADGNSSSPFAGTCFQLLFNTTTCTGTQWIMDSGASIHICSNINLFAHLQPIKNTTVILPNQTRIPVSQSGDVRLGNQLTIHNVLFLPDFGFNLLSVSALATDHNLNVTFLSDSFLIQENRTLKTIGKGNKLNGLYILDPTVIESLLLT